MRRKKDSKIQLKLEIITCSVINFLPYIIAQFFKDKKIEPVKTRTK